MSRRKYSVASIAGPTIHGTGSLVGEQTVFVRLAGCNMWDGREVTKGASRCHFCDASFQHGEYLTAQEILTAVRLLMPSGMVTFTGGEPMLQLDFGLAETMVGGGYRVAVETNGTRRLTHDMKHVVSHVLFSPKGARDEIALTECDDLILLFPYVDARISAEAFADFPSRYRFLQPVNRTKSYDMISVKRALTKLADLNAELPPEATRWRLSTQAAKGLGLVA